MRVALAVGGTGGHILPALTLARQLRSQGVEVHLIGVYLEHNPHLDRSFSYGSVLGSNRCPFRMVLGVWQSMQYLRKHKVDLVVGFGSYHSFPPLVSSRLLRKPFVLCEANLWPGKVNRLFSKWAKWTAVQFLEAQELLSSPVKSVNFLCEQFKALSTSREEAAHYFSLCAEKLTVLIFGGSHGAFAINQKMVELAHVWGSDFQVIHLIGRRGKLDEVKERYTTCGVTHVVKPFEEHMHYAYALADFAIARAGAATIAELIHFQVPALLIPYPNATDGHQTKNARYFVDVVGGGALLEEKEFDQLPKVLESFFTASFIEEKKGALYSYRADRGASSLADYIKDFSL